MRYKQGGPPLINSNQTNTPHMHNSTNWRTDIKLNYKKKKNEEWRL